LAGPISSSADERVTWRPGVETRLHVSGSSGAQSLCVMEQWCEPGAGAPTHTHFDVEEVISVLDGVAEVWIDGETSRVAAGSSIVLPPGSFHGFRNDGGTELHTLAVFASARPLVAYEGDPDTLLAIGVQSENMLDAHRAHVERGDGSRR
jgi:quercetin dioxygenase-like cupin family protein